MPNTPTMSLPYPEGINTADVPRDIKALADAVDLWSVPIVTSLPTTGLFNGKTVDYQFPMPPNQPIGNVAGVGGGLWRLRYDTAVTDPYKWRWLGGTDWTAVSASVWDPGPTTAETVDPELQCTVALPGYYDVWAKVTGMWQVGGFSEDFRKWGLAAGSTFDYKETNNKTGWAQDQEFVMKPIRLSCAVGTLLHVRWKKALTNDTFYRNPGAVLYVRPHRLAAP